MKVYYHSALVTAELMPGSMSRFVPCRAYLKLDRESTDVPCELLYNGEFIDPDTEEIECGGTAELVVVQNEKRYVYAVRPLVPPLSLKYAGAYEQFAYEYSKMESDEITGIQRGALKLYAVDRSTEIPDYTEVLDRIEGAFKAFKAVCERPRSHLRAVNEVRPIETVKRTGYESIPYLAAHSEDWLARTAGGLRPARLFSRAEDDDYQIYENRVVKTLIDLIILFLRKTDRQLRDRRDQLRGIINSSVQTGSFGFDLSFQKAVSELMSSDDKGDEYRSRSLELAESLQSRTHTQLKRYLSLRQTPLYRYLKKSRPVQSPLDKTNILTMDRHYSVIFKLWKTMHKETKKAAARTVKDESEAGFIDGLKGYELFCGVLCGYAAHVLGFELRENGCYVREKDRVGLKVCSSEDGLIHVELKDTKPRTMAVPPNAAIPIAAGTGMGRFSYDGNQLSWPNDITPDEIDEFCSLLKTRKSRGREQNEEKRMYALLKSLIDEAQRSYGKPVKAGFTVIPLPVELEAGNQAVFKEVLNAAAQRRLDEAPDMDIIAALPACDETEQKITEYAKEEGQHISILPLTMFDISSFRRIQNMLYRQILKLGKESCPNCGGKMRRQDNQLICDSCGQLRLTKTICPNPECRHGYVYMSYDVTPETLEKMRNVQRDSFFEWDSLYQYKDIVNMTVRSGKIRTVCPRCHQG